MDYRTTPSRFDQRLHVPGREGLQGFLHANSDVIALDAVARPTIPALAVPARAAGRDYVDPTLVVQRGAVLRIALRNAIAEPTILHWHGLTRRSGAPDRYTPSPGDRVNGGYGDESLVNFTARPYLDVAQARYRFRALNASNARIYRLGLRGDRGQALRFLLIGTNGRLLESPRAVDALFIAPAERVDLLVDFSTVAVGAFVQLESRAFDPMHGELEPATRDAAGGAMQHDHSHHSPADAVHIVRREHFAAHRVTG